MSPAATGPRVGWGFDAHRLDGPPPLKLGGVVVSESHGVLATSDGDVLAHAVADAVLGASALGDIGSHFPSDDPTLEDVDSMGLLRQVVAMAEAAGLRIAHLDVTVVAESIRIGPHRDEIRARLAAMLTMPEGSVSVKATTTDGLGFIGSGDGIAVVAVVTAEPSS